MKSLFSLLAFLMAFTASGQTIRLLPTAEISVLTVGPGTSLNDAFGHSAFRIKDRQQGLDIVFGYGQYDFDTPNFYLKFAQGKLNYLMSGNDFVDFHRTYVYYNRTIKEQVLNLSAEEKQELCDYLTNNYKPENRAYLYDFFYDNCATRIRDVVEKSSGVPVEFTTPEGLEPKTFRTLIHDYAGKNTWGSFGIDLALGSVIDKEATPYEYMFLPDYIHEFFAAATLDDSKPLVKSSSVIYKKTNTTNTENFIFNPLLIFSIIGFLIISVTYSDYKKGTRSKWLDVTLFGITGITGVLLLLLWLATNHTATAYNYNLLWAFPVNLLVIRQLLKTEPKPWLKNYVRFLLVLFIGLLLFWAVGIQVYSIVLIPLLIALIARYLYLSRTLN